MLTHQVLNIFAMIKRIYNILDSLFKNFGYPWVLWNLFVSICDSHLLHTSVTSLNLLGNGSTSLESWLNLFSGLKVFLHMYSFLHFSFNCFKYSRPCLPSGPTWNQVFIPFGLLLRTSVERNANSSRSLSLPVFLLTFIIVFITWPYKYLTGK